MFKIGVAKMYYATIYRKYAVTWLWHNLLVSLDSVCMIVYCKFLIQTAVV
jgi:hypothetical protein